MPKFDTFTNVRMVALSEPAQRASAFYKHRILTSVSALSLALSLGHASFAQSGNPTQEAQIDEVIVTGSHIVRDGYEAPSPITVVGSEQLNAAAKEDLTTYMLTLPSVLGSYTSQTNTLAGVSGNGQQGVNSISLRGLGSARTLVLLDGRRTTASAPDGTIDVSSFPQELISRVDVVTSGASAVYGSDAVAGVVNFVLDKKFTGVKGSLEGGVTTYGDDRNWKVTLTAGTRFANDRGHFLISGTAAVRDGIPKGSARDWNNKGWQTFVNPSYTATNGQPEYLFLPQVGMSTETPGGLITNTALKGTAFGPGGTPYRYTYGSIVGGTYMYGGDWQAALPMRIASIDPRSKRKSLYTYTSYDLTDNIQAYAEVSWASSYSKTLAAGRDDFGSFVIKADNPYIPASVRAQMTTLGLTQFNMGRSSLDLYDPTQDSTSPGIFNRIQNRYTIGLNGDVDAFGSNWKWDAHFHTGQTRTSETFITNVSNAVFNQSVDAIVSPTTGAVICRSTLTNPTNGCVPINLMGIGTVTEAARLSLLAAPHRNQQFGEDNFSVTVRGEPLSTWAGPVSFATGFEWRKDTINGSVNDTAARDLARSGNYKPTIGSNTVAEGFMETVIPLAKDDSWAKSLDFNAAVRFINYSVSGFATTYKFGATYQPIEDIRFRATRSHDIRAPSLGELYAAGSAGLSNIVDPFAGNASVQYITRSVGNPNLEPEKSNSTQFGVVVQPSFLPGFSASVDYWNIHLTGGMSSLSFPQILNNCFQGQQQFCAAITRSPTLNQILVYPINLASQTRRGVDFEANYNFALSDVVDSWGGTFDIRGLATRYIKALVNSGVTRPVDFVGQNGQDLLGNLTSQTAVPTWVYNFALTYTYNPVILTLSVHGFPSGKKDNRAIECTSGCPTSSADRPTINDNHMAGAFYIDASVAYDVNENAQMFLAVTNLANRDPAPYIGIFNASGNYVAPYSNAGIYDSIGRAFRAGVRFKM